MICTIDKKTIANLIKNKQTQKVKTGFDNALLGLGITIKEGSK